MSHWSGPAVATENRTGAIFAGNFIPQIFASAFIIARIISKAWIRRKWGADDSILCVAWVLSLALTALSCIQTHYGAGIHIDQLPGSIIKINAKIDYASFLLYNLALSLTKISICLFYLDIFADPLNRLLAKIAFVYIVLYTIPLVLVSAFQCIPVTAFWNPRMEASCIDMYPHLVASAVFNTLADTWLTLQVVPNILPLQLPKRQKMILLFVVSLGWLVIIASIFRICRLNAVTDPRDFTWADYDVTIWSAVEVDVGLVCVAAPATKPLFKKIAPGFLRDFATRITRVTPTQQQQKPLGPEEWAYSMPNRPEKLVLPLYSSRYEDDVETVATLSKNWDVGGLLRAASRGSSRSGGSSSSRRPSSGSVGDSSKCVDLEKMGGLEQGSRSSHDGGSDGSSARLQFDDSGMMKEKQNF
ncbi:Integral membrane protein [Lasiodiplodia theobromae]|uniref:Integral membrane protein n=1 Tax=Lasiodiplodia theobromae TaxID=45133 RepID=UPI0015C3D05A|nr:Integral membrane protein [Lasiodiplodia theobromae]KAF4534982.1 Integral membrane protein [Lasiodiplodia theobromae]